MNQLSNQTIISFIELYFNKKGIQLSEDEANSKGLELLYFVRSIYKPVVKDDHNQK